MENQMDRTAHVEGLSKMYPILGPAFLVAVGFLDASKWITMIDAGSCFGFELAWLLLLNNLIAILCQSLAVRIGVATSKDLAQICAEEYPRPLCILLWLQCEVSLLALDFAAVLGTAIALHLLLDQEIFCCMLLSMFAVVSVPVLLPLMGKRHFRLISLSMLAMMTLFFAMDALSNNENVAVLVSGLFPKIKRESLYTAASLIGANILPHHFYLHSSLIQEQKKVKNLSIETLSYCNFLEIAFVFSAILLMNASMLSSAATVFHDSGLRVLTFLDIQYLVEQMFRNSFARVVFFLALFCTSQLSALTRTLGGQLAINGFLGANRNWWFNHSSIKGCVITLLMSLVWKAGNIDVYWFLIFCHVMLALQLPAAVIPLFRVASSKLIMKTYRISQSLEALCWLSFLWIVIFNFMFLFDILLGNSRWVVSLKYNSGGGMSFLYFLILMVASVSLGFTLWLVSTPLNCENQKTIMQSENTCPDLPSENVEPALGGEPSKQEREFKASTSLKDDIAAPDEAKANDLPTFDGSKDRKELNVGFENVLDQRNLPEAQERTVISSQNMSSKVADSDNEMKSSYIDLQPPPSAPSKEVPTSTASQIVSDSSSVDNMSKAGGASLKSDSETGHDDDDVDGWEQEDVPMDIPESVSSVALEEPGSYRSTGGRSDEGGSGSGSLSRLAGLGRAARRHFAAILDEFWGKFFDFHGQMTEQARLKRLDLALGLKVSQNQGSLTSNGNVNVANEPKYSVDQEKKPWQHISINVPVIGMTSNMEPCESINTGPSVSRNVYRSSHLSPNSPSGSYSTYSRQSGSALYGGERRYSSLHMPSFKESFSSLPEYQTYQTSPFPSLERKSIGSFGSSSIDSSSASHPVTNPSFRAEDSLRNDMVGSVFNRPQRYDSRNVALEQTFLQGGQHHYFNKTRSHDYSQTIGQAKKYHSLPDIPYREMMLQWNNFSRQEHDQRYPMAQISATEIERYESFGSSSFGSAFRHAPISRTDSYNDRMKNHDEKVPLAFDELSPSPLHRDAFSLQATSKAHNTSLWSKQPFEQLFGSSGHKNVVNFSERNGFSRVTPNPRENTAVDIEVEILQNLRCCVTKLLRLEGSEWLFQKKWGFDEERYGFDEELINLVARKEKIDQDADTQNQYHEASFGAAILSIPHCGDGCVWGVDLFISFGVWCIHRILELSRMESRPELWGKYTYVLNRLQGILEPAFSKPRFLLSPCFCLQLPPWEEGSGRKLGSSDGSLLNTTVASSVVHSSQGKVPSNKRKATSATVFLEIIKNVEIAVGSRKGRTGTAAGDVAFPKGKENLASVLKRYKRRLSNKPPGSLETNGSKRKAVR